MHTSESPGSAVSANLQDVDTNDHLPATSNRAYGAHPQSLLDLHHIFDYRMQHTAVTAFPIVPRKPVQVALALRDLKNISQGPNCNLSLLYGMKAHWRDSDAVVSLRIGIWDEIIVG